MQQPDFWSDTNQAKKITKQATEIRQKLDEFSDLEKQYQNLVDWFEISEEGTEEWDVLETDIRSTTNQTFKAFEIKTLLNEPYDSNNAIIELHPGAGGTESQDWVICFIVCIIRYAQKKTLK
jgi:peptide chain release factor 2